MTGFERVLESPTAPDERTAYQQCWYMEVECSEARDRVSVRNEPTTPDATR
jgi:hypothetical protein